MLPHWVRAHTKANVGPHEILRSDLFRRFQEHAWAVPWVSSRCCLELEPQTKMRVTVRGPSGHIKIRILQALVLESSSSDPSVAI